jgi:hypothetical protein
MPTKRPPLVGEVVPTFADRGCCMVSATDPPGRILGFLDWSRYYFFRVAPQLSSRGNNNNNNNKVIIIKIITDFICMTVFPEIFLSSHEIILSVNRKVRVGVN